jgi:hypothetical protein
VIIRCRLEETCGDWRFPVRLVKIDELPPEAFFGWYNWSAMNPSFTPIIAAARYMEGFSGPWFVSGGWAIDLYLGRVTRRHADIEIGIYRSDQDALWRQLPDWSFTKAIQTPSGGKWTRWERNEWLELPFHQILATYPHADPPELEFFLNEQTETHWVSRRHSGLKRPMEEISMVSRLDIPILMPEIQLLYKAKYTRIKDHADFELTLPRLKRSQREWLASALQQYHPDHPWLEAIEDRDAV